MMYALPPSGVPITFHDIAAGMNALQRGDSCLELLGNDISRYFGVKHCFFYSSGRAALSILLHALSQLYPERNEVVLPAYTSFSVPSAVVNAGLKVSLYDLENDTLSPDIGSLKNALSERSLCIVACHLYGYPCNMDAVLQVAHANKIPVIDDAAQAMGAKYKGNFAGTLGTAGIFSLSRGKNITAVDGGIVVTNSQELAKQLSGIILKKQDYGDFAGNIVKAFLLSFFINPRFYWLPLRLPFLHIGASEFAPDFSVKMLSSFQSGICGAMLAKLQQINKVRIEKAGLLMARLKDCTGITMPVVNKDADPVFLRLPVFSRNGLITATPELGIVRSYPAPLNCISALRPYLVSDREHPVAASLAERVFTLPTNQFVSEEHIALIVRHIYEGQRSHG